MSRAAAVLVLCGLQAAAAAQSASFVRGASRGGEHDLVRDRRDRYTVLLEAAGARAWTEGTGRGYAGSLRIDFCFSSPRYELGGTGTAWGMQVQLAGWDANGGGGGGVTIGASRIYLGDWLFARGGVGLAAAMDSVHGDLGVGFATMPEADAALGIRIGHLYLAVEAAGIYRVQFGASDRGQLLAGLGVGGWM